MWSPQAAIVCKGQSQLRLRDYKGTSMLKVNFGLKANFQTRFAPATFLAPSARTTGRPGHTQHLNRDLRSHLCSLNWLTWLDLSSIQLSCTAGTIHYGLPNHSLGDLSYSQMSRHHGRQKETMGPNTCPNFWTYSSVHLKTQLCCFNRCWIKTLLRTSGLTLLHGLHQQVATEFPYWNFSILKVPEKYLWVMLINLCLIAVKGTWQISQRGISGHPALTGVSCTIKCRCKEWSHHSARQHHVCP